MEECVQKGKDFADETVQTVLWVTTGKCIGHYNTDADQIIPLPNFPTAMYLCVLDESMAQSMH